MYMIRRLIMMTIVITALLINGGCSEMGNHQRTDTAQNALEQKYGEAFTVFETRSADAGGFYAWAYPQTDPEIVFRACLSEDGSAVTDNYPVRIICHDLSEKAEWYLKEYEGEIFVFTDNRFETTFDDGKDISAQEHLDNNPGDMFYISIFAGDNNADLRGLYNMITVLIPELGFDKGSVDTYLVPAERLTELQNEIERYNYMESDEVKEILDEGRHYYIDVDPSVEMPSFDEYRRGLE